MFNIFASSPFTLVLLALFITSCTLPMYIPDSYEQAFGYICRFQQHSSCTQANLYFRPPAMSFFLAPLSVGMSPFLAVGVLSMLCSAWCILPLAWVVQQQTKSNILMWCGVLAVLLSPSVHLLNSLADARIFVLPFLFASWSMFFIVNPKRHHLIISGLMMGIAGTARPELLLGILLISGFSLYLHKKKSIWTMLGAWTPYFVWIAALSLNAQKLVFGPRHWEGALLSIWEFVPKRMALRLYGMGMYNPPARSISNEITTTHTVDFGAGAQWLLQIVSMTPVVFVVGVVMMFISWNKHKKIVSVSLAIALPYLAASFLPQARAPLFPQANMIPILIVLYCYTGIAVGHLIFTYTTLPKIVRASLALILFATHFATVHLPDQPSGIEYTPSGSQAQQYLRQRSPSSYASSYENASLVWLSNKEWHQNNSPWDDPASKYVVRSSIDMDVIPDEKPISFWAHEDNWVLITHSDFDNRD